MNAEAKHTPGPWVANMQRHRDGRALGWIVEHSNGRIGWASLAYADTNREADDTDPARDANARLIAAAPDLLAVLNDIAAFLTWNECAKATPQIRMSKADISNALDHAILSARAAISRAAS